MKIKKAVVRKKKDPGPKMHPLFKKMVGDYSFTPASVDDTAVGIAALKSGKLTKDPATQQLLANGANMYLSLQQVKNNAPKLTKFLAAAGVPQPVIAELGKHLAQHKMGGILRIRSMDKEAIEHIAKSPHFYSCMGTNGPMKEEILKPSYAVAWVDDAQGKCFLRTVLVIYINGKDEVVVPSRAYGGGGQYGGGDFSWFFKLISEVTGVPVMLGVGYGGDGALWTKHEACKVGVYYDAPQNFYGGKLYTPESKGVKKQPKKEQTPIQREIAKEQVEARI